jgi:hypothetical protein
LAQLGVIGDVDVDDPTLGYADEAERPRVVHLIIRPDTTRWRRGGVEGSATFAATRAECNDFEFIDLIDKRSSLIVSQ